MATDSSHIENAHSIYCRRFLNSVKRPETGLDNRAVATHLGDFILLWEDDG